QSACSEIVISEARNTRCGWFSTEAGKDEILDYVVIPKHASSKKAIVIFTPSQADDVQQMMAKPMTGSNALVNSVHA
ncbi:MAG: hypothetical protein Q9191_003807, partial [Dirinaria sp. TL-2023a]